MTSTAAPTRDPDERVLLVERSGGVVTLTFNRPARRNAIDDRLWTEFGDELTRIERSGQDRVVVIQGAAGQFCAGADVSGLADEERHGLARMRWTSEGIVRLAHLPQPTIAKVSGAAVGIGMNIALACDFVVAATDARFSEIFRHRGLSVDGGGSWSLVRSVGLRRAKELVLLGEFVSGADAAALGLVNRAVPADELDAVVDGWAAALIDGPPIALAQSKALLNRAFERTLEEALDDEGRAQTINFATDDVAEAVAAFLEKRTPTFRGR